MKKTLRISFFYFLGFIFLLIGVSTIVYSTYWAKDSDTEVIEDNLHFFHENYEACRSAFVNAAEQVASRFDSVEIGRFFVDSEVDTNLTVDWCYIPAQFNSQKLLIINSGLHGVEGYTGSAIQTMFMETLLTKSLADSINILMVHAINPYGFKYRRKVTEHNVDLNRNCVVNSAMYANVNEGYEKLISLLMPEGKVSVRSVSNQFFHLLAIRKIIQESMAVLRQAALQGQYKFNKGIYYGGIEKEPQINKLKVLLNDKMANSKVIVNLDLHTAYGERGKMHLFLNPIDDKAVKQGVETIFSDSKIDWGSGKDFYTINGEYVGWAKTLSGGALYIPMLFEFGTMDSQKTFGSLKSIQVMINENQGVHYGYKNWKQEQIVKNRFSQMYYPTSPEWRSKVISDSYKAMESMLINLNNFSVGN
jgi:hypothetical protein